MIYLSIFFIFLTALRLAYWIFFFKNVGRKSVTIDSIQQFEPVSIVVCAKNAYFDLEVLIPLLIQQDYPNFEIIIVDDYSIDDTKLLKHKYQDEIKWIVPDKDLPGKKHALACGIYAASHPVVCLTDSDCRPGAQWVASMVKHLQGQEVVLGFSPIKKSKGWLNLLSRYETLFTAIQYFGYAIKGIPYMGVGRNLMYRKRVFEESDGFTKHEGTLSGDDDLFIQNLPLNTPINVNINSESFVYTNSKNNFSSYLNQKRRHTSTSFEYRMIHKTLLTIWALSHIAWILILGMGVLFVQNAIIFSAIVFWILATILHYFTFIKLDHKEYLMLFPILDILLGINYLILGADMIFKSKNNSMKWN